MVDFVVSGLALLLALILVFLNGFFVAAEFAFVRVRATSVEQLVEEGRRGASVLEGVMSNLDDYLAVSQLGITIASLGLGWIGEPAVASLIEPALEAFIPDHLIRVVAFALGFGFITFLHVVFGELAPKTIAIARAERLALLVAPPMRACYYLFLPGLVVFNGTANAITRSIGIPPASEANETLEEQELRRILMQSGEEGHVDSKEVAMIESVFDLDDTIVREVMVPRPDVVLIAADASLPEIRSTIFEAGHTRYPVVASDDQDQVIGSIDVKDVLRASESGTDDTTAADLIRDVMVIPEMTPLDRLLVQFRDEQQQMAAIIDEWGVIEGIATVEDVVEAIVGDLRDAFDAVEREPSIDRREDGRFDIDGGVSLSIVNETLCIDLESEEFDTIGGLVLERLGRAPEPGDRIEERGHLITVTLVDGTRISRVHVQKRDHDDPQGR